MNTYRHFIHGLLAPCLYALPLACHATTAAEDEMNKAPMPHASLGSHGPTVKVHLVSANGYLEGRPADATRLSMLHAEVDDCVRRNSASGAASKPPRAWPDHVDSQRIDTYAAVNRTIHYSSALAYGVNPLDCSLLETRRNTARLHSSLGTCDIDLRGKTARGACDATGQASARPPVRLPGLTPAQIDAIERSGASNPAMAAFTAAMRSHAPAAAGEHKTILGLECEVHPNPFDPAGKICESLGGTFASLDVPGDLKQSGMALETTSIAGIQMRATKAQLDTLVGNAVFTPYLAGGFRITNTGGRP
ncbi:MAG: hypothetical protein V4476_10760 [Pseudomonadota bacterium]